MWPRALLEATLNTSAVPCASAIIFHLDRSRSRPEWWFRQSSIAFGARAGIIHSLTTSGPGEGTAIPIDERFFNGGATTVRSFGERDLGPHDNHGHPVGGEFYTVFNVE